MENENKPGKEDDQSAESDFNSDAEQSDALTDDATEAEAGHGEHHGRRRRVKIRKRIRVKKKTSSKRKFRKLFEKIIWIIFIAGFITALVILLKQINISDEKYKAGRKRGMHITVTSSWHYCSSEKKPFQPLMVNSI